MIKWSQIENGEATKEKIDSLLNNPYILDRTGIRIEQAILKLSNVVAGEDSGETIVNNQISDWKNFYTYNEGDIVIYDQCLYRCKNQHISGNDIDKDNWQLIGGTSSSGNGLQYWKQKTHYYVNDIVVYDDGIYKCISEHLSSNYFESINFKQLNTDGSSQSSIKDNSLLYSLIM